MQCRRWRYSLSYTNADTGIYFVLYLPILSVPSNMYLSYPTVNVIMCFQRNLTHVWRLKCPDCLCWCCTKAWKLEHHQQTAANMCCFFHKHVGPKPQLLRTIYPFFCWNLCCPFFFWEAKGQGPTSPTPGDSNPRKKAVVSKNENTRSWRHVSGAGHFCCVFLPGPKMDQVLTMCFCGRKRCMVFEKVYRNWLNWWYVF